MNLFNIGLIITVAILIILYASYYYRYPADVAIIQTSLDNFNFQIFLEKQPIVIHDKIQDVSELRKAWFGANITFNDVLRNNGGTDWVRNRYKFLLIQPQEKTEILIYPPHLKMINGSPDPEQPLLALKVGALQLLILPIHWKYHIENNNIINIGVHDFITPFLP